MNKTLTINLSGQMFNIDEDAYQVLEKYLNSLSVHFNKLGEQEVMSDIESRIAELFVEKMPPMNNVVSLVMVEEVMRVMGKLNEIDDETVPEGETGDLEDKARQFVDAAEERVKATFHRKLFRSTTDKVIAGVCGGLQAWSGIPSYIIRIVFLLLAFCGVGLAVIAYVVLWIACTPATTASQKLEMEGEPVNAQTLSEFNNETSDKEMEKKSGVFSGIWGVIGMLCGIACAIAGMSGLLSHMPNLPNLPNVPFVPIVPWGNTIITALMLIGKLYIPVIVLILAIIVMLDKKPHPSIKSWAIILSIVWVIMWVVSSLIH